MSIYNGTLYELSFFQELSKDMKKAQLIAKLGSIDSIVQVTLCKQALPDMWYEADGGLSHSKEQ